MAEKHHPPHGQERDQDEAADTTAPRVDATGTGQAAALHALGRWAAAYWGTPPRGQRPAGVDELPLTITATDALALGPPPRLGRLPLAVGGDTLELLQVDLAEAGNSVLVAGPRRSGRSNALLFAAQGALDTGLSVVLVLPRRSPLEALATHPGVAGVLSTDARPPELDRLLGRAPGRTLVVVDDYDVLGNDHTLSHAMADHLRDSRDTPAGLLVACGNEEAQGMYGGLMTQVKRNRTGLVLAPRASTDGSVLSLKLPTSVGGPAPKGRGILATTTGWTWTQVPRTTTHTNQAGQPDQETGPQEPPGPTSQADQPSRDGEPAGGAPDEGPDQTAEGQPTPQETRT